MEATAVEQLTRVFRFDNFRLGLIPRGAPTHEITRDYLLSMSPGAWCIEKREYGGKTMYFHIEVPPKEEGDQAIEREITGLEYQNLLSCDRDEAFPTFKWTQYTFPYRGKLFEVDAYHGPLEGKASFRVKLIDAMDSIDMPFGWRFTDVTNHFEFKTRRLVMATP